MFGIGECKSVYGVIVIVVFKGYEVFFVGMKDGCF